MMKYLTGHLSTRMLGSGDRGSVSKDNITNTVLYVHAQNPTHVRSRLGLGLSRSAARRRAGQQREELGVLGAHPARRPPPPREKLC